MADEQSKITFQPSIDTNQKEKVKATERHLVGKIAQHIGTGQNAKDSFIWMTITWSFCIASGISVAFFLVDLCSDGNSSDTMDSIKNTWAIFTPIITLALGYAFGKGQ
ncbi:hypothetical protein WJ038_08685 [Vibrio parahaemolyticus]|uniref:hypothetical protein n=1 Tax=Vibrio TaxID=662 RepID=UPI0004159B63|nr:MULTISPECIES: hypothetical protein [Vibrio]AMG07162.1 hypothetical protein AL464_10360 [Vibrio parahaemolyticus]EGR0429376.1 hypothetical protein [Vibrio parahaemolyticus]EJG0786220.1 hypothetical protein [Vibrio parahaemolyticus]EJG0913754.1 hypothetical protein [Vibrio parahaemolyticus]EJG1593032.1 hypothetical protein [Vibrio parahaemolyticus]